MEEQVNDFSHVIAIIVIIIVVGIGAFFFGKFFNNQTPAGTSTQPNQVQTQQLKSDNTADTITTDSNNGLACKNIADKARSNEQTKSNRLTTVLKSHYNQTLSQCYYELMISTSLSGSDSGNIDYEIRFAPDDDWVAECSTGVYPPPQLFCTKHNVGLITDQEFKQLESTYFNN